MPPVCINISTRSSSSDDEDTEDTTFLPVIIEIRLNLSLWMLTPYYQELERNELMHTSKVEIKFITGVSFYGDKHEMYMSVIIDHSNPIDPKIKQIHYVSRKKYSDNIVIFYDEHKSLKRAVLRHISPYPMVKWNSMRLGPNTYRIHEIIFREVVKRIKYIETNLM